MIYLDKDLDPSLCFRDRILDFHPFLMITHLHPKALLREIAKIRTLNFKTHPTCFLLSEAFSVHLILSVQ